MMLLVGALLAVLLVDPELVLNRRRSRVRAWPASTRRRVGRGARRRSAISAGDVEPSRSPAGQLKISVTDYDRLLVTRLANPATIVVCRPPQQTADGILAAARLVLSQAEYQVLAHHLGQSSSTEPAHS